MLDVAEQKNKTWLVDVGTWGLRLEKSKSNSNSKNSKRSDIRKEYTWRRPWSWCDSVERILPWYPAEGSCKRFEHKSFRVLGENQRASLAVGGSDGE